MANPVRATLLNDYRRAQTESYVVADGVTLYPGSLVGLVAGYLNFWDDGAASVFCGILGPGNEIPYDPNVDPNRTVGDISATPPVECRVHEGLTILHLATLGDTPTAAKVGDLVYSADGNLTSLTLDATGRTHPVGWMSRYRSASDVNVKLFTPHEMLCQATA